MFEYEGRDFIVRAKPFGKNGYHHGIVLYADPKVDKVELVKVEALPPPPVIVEAQGRVLEIDKARDRKDLNLWTEEARRMWLWMKEDGGPRSGLISNIHKRFREKDGEKPSPGRAFFVAVAGERLDYWRITENKTRTRFSLTFIP
jgi:hypothetical protein